MTTSSTTIPNNPTKTAKLRSRNGCLTCRDRHIKCDETVPVCNNCLKSNKICKRGSRLNFLKSITYDPQVRPNYHEFRVVDQSLTIHKFYKFNKFHNFQNWFKAHSLDELFESDEDFEKSLDFINDPLNKNQLRLVSIVELTNGNFNIKQFLNKVLLIHLPQTDHSLFTFLTLQRSLLLQSFNLELDFTENKSLESLSTQDFKKYVEFLDTLEITTERFESHYNIFLNSLNLAMKLKKIAIFNSKETNQFMEKLHLINSIEALQNFDNLMYCFEIWLLDLNNSILNNTSTYFSVIYDDKVEFLLNKILHLNLFNDLNYFLIKILTILLKLNNVYNEYSTHLSQNYELFLLIKDLKNFENNQFLSMCFPKVVNYYQLEFQNLKTRKFHIWYNFVIVFILSKFHVSSDLKNMLFTDTVLLNFWQHVEQNPFKRLSSLISNYDYADDPFMSFLKNYLIDYESDESMKE